MLVLMLNGKLSAKTSNVFIIHEGLSISLHMHVSFGIKCVVEIASGNLVLVILFRFIQSNRIPLKYRKNQKDAKQASGCLL